MHFRLWASTVAAAALIGPEPVGAELPEPQRLDGAVIYTVAQPFEDVVFGVENAIIGEGLVIDSTSHVGAMLERTRGDVGSDVVLYDAADVFSFCSAAVSREVMEADPLNIQFCPYDIFVYTLADAPGETHVGYRDYPDGPMDAVETLLDGIVRSALGTW